MNKLIIKHGGYRSLKSFQLARMIYDITIRFCNKFVPINSRTKDQMVQAARSGVQNIAEGSQASGTSKKTELKLTNVARASLEELGLDYQDFLRHHGFKFWEYNSSIRKEFGTKRFVSADDFILWVKHKHQEGCGSVSELAANGTIHLISLTCRLLDKQIQSQADAFMREGGFTERLYKMRKDAKSF